VHFKDIGCDVFLTADRPEEIMLAALSDFGTTPPAVVAESIVRNIIAHSSGPLSADRHFLQLLVLGNLRNLGPIIITAMESLLTLFKEENHILYKRGEASGEARGIELAIGVLLREGKMSEQHISDTFNISIAKVRAIKRRLKTSTDS